MIIKELEPIAAFELVMLLEHTDVHYSIQSIDNFINGFNYTSYGAYSDDRLVGALVVTEMMDTVDIMQIVTHPNHRQKGVASSLMNHFIKLNSKPIILEVNESNEAAIKLYERFNFKTINKRLNYYGGKKHALVMRKDY